MRSPEKIKKYLRVGFGTPSRVGVAYSLDVLDPHVEYQNTGKVVILGTSPVESWLSRRMRLILIRKSSAQHEKWYLPEITRTGTRLGWAEYTLVTRCPKVSYLTDGPSSVALVQVPWSHQVLTRILSVEGTSTPLEGSFECFKEVSTYSLANRWKRRSWFSKKIEGDLSPLI